MSGMDMLDMLPNDKDRVISSLREEVIYWKRRSEILEEYCRGVRKLIDDDAIKRITEDSHITKDESTVKQDKLDDQEDYKLIAEKAKAENAVLREEIERLHATIRVFSTPSLPAPTSPTVSPWNKKSGIPDYARYNGPIKLTRG